MSSSKKIIAGVLAVAMVLTLVVGVAVSTASAQTSTYTRNLTVGSRGADVTALQTTLVTGGYLKVAPTGYFGALTKAALAAWQAASGISPAVGYFGPISRAAIGGTVPPVVQPPVVTGLDNTDGSITASASTVVGSTVTIKKGETKDMIATKLSATAGKVAVNRFDVWFSERPWLTFSKFELVDNNSGAVLATKNVSGASDFTEITVGTKYLLRFADLNVVVTPGQDLIVKVRGSVMAASDKVANQVVTVTLPTAGIRTVNGKGYTDSSAGTGTTVAVTLSSTGSSANILGRVNPNTPEQKIITTSTSGQTNNVIVGVFDLKSENQSSTINTLKFTLGNNGASQTAWSAALKNLRLTDGTNTYYPDSIATTTTFSSLSIALPQDAWKSLTLTADVADQDEFTSGSVLIASTTVNTTNIVGIDSNYNTVTASGANIVSANQITFLAAGVSVSNIVTNKGTVATPSSGAWLAAYPSLGFTLTNNGSTDVFVSKVPNSALGTTTSSGANASSTVSSVVASGSTTGDTSNAYIIPANGSRTFTYNYTIDNTYGSTAGKKLSITAIYFGTGEAAGSGAGQNAQYNIAFGLQNLYVQVP